MITTETKTMEVSNFHVLLSGPCFSLPDVLLLQYPSRPVPHPTYCNPVVAFETIRRYLMLSIS